MTTFVIDSSVAIKWAFEEDDTPRALALLRHRLAAPDLLIAECANAIWKKVGRREITPDEASVAARLLERTVIQFAPTRSLLEVAVRIAVELNHPAYDCLYLGLAAANQWQFVTADHRLVQKVRRASPARYGAGIRLLSEMD